MKIIIIRKIFIKVNLQFPLKRIWHLCSKKNAQIITKNSQYFDEIK